MSKTPTHTCVYCGTEGITFIGEHHHEEHPSKRYDPVWYMDDPDDDRRTVEDCETIDDCELPTGISERHDDGERVVCPKCGRVWEHNGGYFTQTGRRLNTVDDPDDDLRTDGGNDVGDGCSGGSEHPQSYNDWVQVIENNDAGVAAQLVVEVIEELEDRYLNTDSDRIDGGGA